MLSTLTPTDSSALYICKVLPFSLNLNPVFESVFLTNILTLNNLYFCIQWGSIWVRSRWLTSSGWPGHHVASAQWRTVNLDSTQWRTWSAQLYSMENFYFYSMENYVKTVQRHRSSKFSQFLRSMLQLCTFPVHFCTFALSRALLHSQPFTTIGALWIWALDGAMLTLVHLE